MRILAAFEVGLGLTTLKRQEDSVRAGGNAYFTTVLQGAQAHFSLSLIGQALDCVGRGPVPLAARCIVYLTPLLLAVAQKKNWISDRHLPRLAFVRDQLGTVCQVASLISSIALLYFGQVPFAAISLALLSAGFLERNLLLPVRVRQFIHSYSAPLQIVSGVFSEDLGFKLLALLNTIGYALDLQSSHNQPLFSPPNLTQNTLTYQRLLDILDDRASLQIDRNYVHHLITAPVPSVDIQELSDLLSQTDWNRHREILRQKLKLDQRFLERKGNPDAGHDLIEFVSSSLQSFIDSVKNRNISAGEPRDYDRMHNYLKRITQYLKECPDEIQKTDMLFCLAIEGGEYCGPGKFEVAEDLDALILTQNPTVPFVDKIFHCLQDFRNALIKELYKKEVGLDTQSGLVFWLGKIMDWQDPHNYNLNLNLYGDELGLRRSAAQNDETATLDPVSKRLLVFWGRGSAQKEFWSFHTPLAAATHLQEVFGASRLPKPEVYQWWREWINRQPFEETRKDILREELGLNASLFGFPLELNGKLQPQFILAMLFDLGVVVGAIE